MNPAPYELLCRHPHLFNQGMAIIGTGAVLPPDWVQLMRQHQTRFLTWDWMTHRQAQLLHINSQFGTPLFDSTETDIHTAIVLWPKSKDLGLLLVQQWISRAHRLWIVGANDAGGKSIGNACKRIGVQCSKEDAARHCSLWAAQAPSAQRLFSESANSAWMDKLKPFSANQQEFVSLPGVFSYGQLDKGTALLLDTLDQELNKAPTEVLDLGCGTGVIGLSLKKRFEETAITLADTDAIALSSSRLNTERLFPKANDIHITASDRFSDISGRYQMIVTNPPFHTGVETDYRFAQDLFSKSKQHLKLNGQLWIVANRHLPYEEWALDYFDSKLVHIHKQASGFKVLQITASN